MSNEQEDVNLVALVGYLNESLPAADMALIEEKLRESHAWRTALHSLADDIDFGDHSVATIWQRHRLTCPTRESLFAYRHVVLPPEEMDYITFHLQVVQCRFCLANLADIGQQLEGSLAPHDAERAQRVFRGSVAELRHPPEATP